MLPVSVLVGKMFRELVVGKCKKMIFHFFPQPLALSLRFSSKNKKKNIQTEEKWENSNGTSFIAKNKVFRDFSKCDILNFPNLFPLNNYNIKREKNLHFLNFCFVRLTMGPGRCEGAENARRIGNEFLERIETNGELIDLTVGRSDDLLSLLRISSDFYSTLHRLSLGQAVHRSPYQLWLLTLLICRILIISFSNMFEMGLQGARSYWRVTINHIMRMFDYGKCVYDVFYIRRQHVFRLLISLINIRKED